MRTLSSKPTNNLTKRSLVGYWGFGGLRTSWDPHLCVHTVFTFMSLGYTFPRTPTEKTPRLAAGHFRRSWAKLRLQENGHQQSLGLFSGGPLEMHTPLIPRFRVSTGFDGWSEAPTHKILLRPWIWVSKTAKTPQFVFDTERSSVRQTLELGVLQSFFWIPKKSHFFCTPERSSGSKKKCGFLVGSRKNKDLLADPILASSEAWCSSLQGSVRKQKP